MANKDFIEKYLRIVNKEGQEIPFVLNSIQNKYLEDYTGRDFILKARQQGFSSLILAMFTKDFLTKENSRSVIVADIADNASELLDRVKMYINAFEDIAQTNVPLKYNSKYELYNTELNSRYTIGTADNRDFGRSKTITNLHLSEFAFYTDAQKLFAGVMQAVVPEGQVIIETTANGFNFAKEFWDKTKLNETGFKALFYGADKFYSQEFLEQKKRELGRYYEQEYPNTELKAFLTSGDSFFSKEALTEHYNRIKPPMDYDLIYG